MIGKQAQYCGGRRRRRVFSDNFETADGLDDERPGDRHGDHRARGSAAIPAATTSSGAKQLGTTVSGVNDLVTGAAAGAAAGDNDVDGGVTSITSPAIALHRPAQLRADVLSPTSRTARTRARADFLRVRVIGDRHGTVFQRLGAATNVNGAWRPRRVSLSAFAGQTIRIVFEAADASTASLVEAGVDDVRVTRS